MPERIGAYEILGTIGQGASAVVYLAEQTELARRVALKALSPSLRAQPGFIERFRHEAQVMALLDHPNCVRVWEFFEEDAGAYLAMEYVPGASLRAVIKQAGRLSPEQSLGVLRGALSGLAHAHGLGLTHRDLKPENIIADPEGTSKLVDFGQAIAPGEAGMPSGSSGTPAYMSPEQARGEAGDVRSDVYAASAILYELLTGEPPFSGESPLALMRKHISEPVPDARKLNRNLSERVAALMGRGMAKEPGERFQTAAEFLAALEEAADDAYGAAWEAASSIRALVGSAVAASGLAAGAGAGASAAGASEATGAMTGAGLASSAGAAADVAAVTASTSTAPAAGVASAVTGPPAVRQSTARRAALLAAGLLAVGNGVLAGAGAGLAGVGPLAIQASPSPSLSSSPASRGLPGPGTVPAVTSVDARYDGVNTTRYHANSPVGSASYTWQWIKQPPCGSLDTSHHTADSGYTHEGCDQVAEAGGVIGVCIENSDGAALYQRNARFGDGIDAAVTARAGVASESFSLVSSGPAPATCTSLGSAATPVPGPRRGSPPPRADAAAQSASPDVVGSPSATSSPAVAASPESNSSGAGMRVDLDAAVAAVGGLAAAAGLLLLLLLRRP